MIIKDEDELLKLCENVVEKGVLLVRQETLDSICDLYTTPGGERVSVSKMVMSSGTVEFILDKDGV